MSINYLSFNQQTTNLACAVNNGFIIYKLTPNIEKRIFTDLHKSTHIIKMLNSTNLSVLVGGGGGDTPFRSPNTVVLWDDNKKSSILEIDMKEKVKNVHITQSYLIITTDSKLTVCSIQNAAVLSKKETYDNKLGLCKITTSIPDDKLIKIATLGQLKGEVLLWDFENDTTQTIKAHDNDIAAISLNHDASLLATASVSGTNIHVYDTKTLQLKYKFRRGSTQALIYDICFDFKSNYLACTSRTGTVHIFELNNIITNTNSNTNNSKSVLSAFSDYLPEYFNSEWSSQKISLNDISKAIISFDKNNILHIVTYTGYYYRISCSSKTGKYDNVSKHFIYPEQN